MSVSELSERMASGPERGQRSVRVPQLAFSLLVVAVFGLLAVWWQAQTTSRVPALALAHDVQAGVPLIADDLTLVHVNTDVPTRIEPPEFRDFFVGVAPLADLEAGTIITGPMFRQATSLGPNEALVGLRLAGDEAPSGLRVGDRVQVLQLVDDEVDVMSADAQVEFVKETNDDGGVAVRLRLGLAQAQSVQLVADRVVLIEVDAQGPASWESGSLADEEPGS